MSRRFHIWVSLSKKAYQLLTLQKSHVHMQICQPKRMETRMLVDNKKKMSKCARFHEQLLTDSWFVSPEAEVKPS